MTQEIIVTTKDDLRTLLREELSPLKPKESSFAGSDELLKRTDIAKMLQVTLPTVHAWMNQGKLPFHRIGSRVFFKKQEVLDAMQSVKNRKRYL